MIADKVEDMIVSLKKALVLIALFFCKSLLAQNRIVVTVNNFKGNKGVCRGCVFANASSFSGEGKPLQCTQSIIKNKVAQLVFENVPAGVYAVSVFHDINSNQELDKNFLGIPKEGYGASKNKLPFASAPGFEDNKFSVSDHTITQLNIRLRNL